MRRVGGRKLKVGCTRLSISFHSPLLRPQGPEFLPVVVLSVCQLLCFPFALDVDADLLEGVLADLTDSEVTAHLLQVLGKLPRQEGGRGRWPNPVYSNSLPDSSGALAGPCRSAAPGLV